MKRASISLQINVYVRAPRNGRELPRAIIDEAIRHKMMTGEDPPGMRLRFVDWHHGSKARTVTNSKAEWRSLAIWIETADITTHVVRTPSTPKPAK